MIIAQSGHLDGSKEYLIVLLIGLDYSADFSVTDTAKGGFFVVFPLDRAPFRIGCSLAGEAIELASV